MHLDYGRDLNDMQSYMKLKIPAARNVSKTRLVVSQPTQKLSLTQLHDKLHSLIFFHKTSMRGRRDHWHLIAYLGVSVSIKDKVNVTATLSVPEVTLLDAVTSDYLRGLEFSVI